jgi:NADP-dependent 3-hydroxy acid dehydrogenase YdfG
VFAGTRDSSRTTELEILATKFLGKLHIVNIVAADESGNKAAIEEIKDKAGRLDVVIANAGSSPFLLVICVYFIHIKV